MHELPIVQQVLKTVLAYAESRGAAQVKTVFLEIGEMHDLIPEWVKKYFAFASRGTAAEGAQVLISRQPVVAECRACGRQFRVDLHQEEQLTCPDCRNGQFYLISGKEFHIRGIEVC